MLTVAHMTKKAPILGIGAGERMNIDPYGLEYDHPVSRLDEALQIIRRCFTEPGPAGTFTLDNALMDLRPPRGRIPAICIFGHGPKMLELTATLGDGWYPTIITARRSTPPHRRASTPPPVGAGPDGDHACPAPLRRRRPHRTGSRGTPAAPLVTDARVRRASPTVAQPRCSPPLRRRLLRLYRHHPPVLRPTHPRRRDRRRTSRTHRARTAAVEPPAQIIDKLREYGDAGLRHVVLAPVSGLVSTKAALYAFWALCPIARALRRLER